MSSESQQEEMCYQIYSAQLSESRNTQKEREKIKNIIKIINFIKTFISHNEKKRRNEIILPIGEGFYSEIWLRGQKCFAISRLELSTNQIPTRIAILRNC